MGKQAIKLKSFDLAREYPQVLLMGNGPCRSAGQKSCETLIRDISNQYSCSYGAEQLEKLTFPMRVVAASNDHVDEACRLLSKEMCSPDYYKDTSPFRQIVGLPMDAFLTTNYSYDLEFSLDEKFFSRKDSCARFTSGCPKLKSKDGQSKGYRREAKFQLHSFYQMNAEECVKNIWHIHGEASNANSMVLGLYLYCNLLAKYRAEDEQYIKRWAKENPLLLNPASWLDYFIFGDVYVLGFGFDLAETDLWWLLNRKKREVRPHGKVYFLMLGEEKLPTEKQIMFDMYDVAVVSIAAKNYDDYYTNALNAICKNTEKLRHNLAPVRS